MVEETLERFTKIQQLRLAVDDGEHVDAERLLQRGVLVKLVENDVRRGVALELDHDAHAFPVRLVADIGNAFDLFIIDQVGYLLDQPLALFDHERNFTDDDLLFARALDRLGESFAAHLDDALAFGVSLDDRFHTINKPPVGKSGPGIYFINSRIVRSGFSTMVTSPSITSLRLCGGILVAMPTAIPAVPLTSKFGMRDGKTVGSL